MTSLMLFVVGWSMMLLGSVEGHGRLTQPWGRSSLWRDQVAYPGFQPRDYNDNQLFCGGLSHQIGQGYKCGICGDPYDESQPRKHEIGGPYYKGYLVANYTTEQVIDVTVQITANHKGFFQFKLCPVPGFQTEATQECLDRTVLKVAGTDETEYHITNEIKDFHLQLQLPADLQCDHCVFQWRYHTGNSWGNCGNGTGSLGCGPQEEFYGCADVSVLDNGPPVTGTTSTGTSTLATTATTAASTTTTAAPVTTTTSTTTTTTSTTTTTTSTTPSGGTICTAVPPYNTIPSMNQWCQVNCHWVPPNCPPSHCRCQ